MIRINLIPAKRKKKPKPIPTFAIAGVLLLVFALIASIYGMYFMNSRIENMQRQKADNQQKIAELNKKIKEVKDFEARNKVFTDRKNIIEELTKNQSMPVRILDELSMRLTEGVWIESLDIAQNEIKVSGTGFSNSDIVTLVQSLKGSAMFSDVVLIQTASATESDVSVFKFSLTLKVKA